MVIKEDRAYVRVSTLKDSQKDSPEHQEAFIRERAERENIDIAKVYEDRDSATSIVAREDVQEMISDAKRGEIRSLWFASLSRFSRDALDAISLKRILVNALKIRVVSIEDGYDSAVKDDELLFGIKSVVNQNTSGDISQSSRRGIRQSAAKGNYIGSIPPYGYRKVVVDGRKTLEVVPEQAKIVQKIFDLYLTGNGEKSIVKYLNGENEDQTPIPSYRGGVWGLTSVQRLLQNENYTGYTVYGRHTIEVSYNDLSDLMDRGKKLVQKPKSEWQKTTFQTHEAIISKEVFDQAQEVRLLRGGGTRGGRRSFANVFSKFIFCAECGTAMVSMGSKTNNKSGIPYRYLMCSRRRRTGEAGCCNGKWIPYYDFRDELIKGILDRVRNSIRALEEKGTNELQAQLPESTSLKEKKKLEKRVEDNRKLLFEIRRQHMLGDIEAAQYEFEKEQYEKDISESEHRLAIIEANERRSLDREKVIKDAKAALKALTDLKTYDDVEKTRVLLMQMVKRIDVNKDGETHVQTYI
ncbi:DNA invertase Pin-like site-specific DNA recombinase [Paenibacillus rhizosphaerae]|uniref:DNA invertase Pin-like site-specific DNA recombinase n=1 Tax=Paenibacillus rhizosphaerae TaxID=297318 RepID=A0A839TZ10_9BACL|nr:recombinase family protein [Paenibacillus rhizosphaerae]MBB3132176.1 DNA invertase Pin-like site-specific DNA recombinase [Paenibacillus rhizosphaerae]